MVYEPTSYVIEYELGALVFFLVIMIRFFKVRRFPNQKNAIFALILWVTLVDLVLDVISSLIIENVFVVPLPITFVVNAAFYALQILLPVLMTAYVYALLERLSRYTLKRFLPVLAPGILMLLLLITTPFTHWFFYVDPVEGYVHGSLFIFTYVVAFFYMCVTFRTAFKYRKTLRHAEFITICRFLVIVLASMVVQYIFPSLLVSGVAIALSVTLMYFRIQNPESMLDPTTGAFTYEALLTFLHDRSVEQKHVQIVALKVHNMSRINEMIGIENGSLLLRQLCTFLSGSTGDTWVFRIRGSYFAAIAHSESDYLTLCTRVTQRMNVPWNIKGIDILINATVCGLSTGEISDTVFTPQQTVFCLETAFLQNSRCLAKDKFIDIGTKFMARLKRSSAVEAALRSAIDTGDGLELYLQLLWSVKEQRYSSAEVLLRFDHPEMGRISPDEFVPIAEANGLVTAMDELVVRKACAFMRDSGCIKKFGITTLDVNLSALEFMHLRLPSLISDILNHYGVDPKVLCFEITETAATESFDLLLRCINELRETGCKFALDDFGTGYANISQVIQLPFSTVKLDKSLLYSTENVLPYLANMFSRMNRLTVAEGVETEEQASLVKLAGVDYIQGYYYARPMNCDEFMEFMSKAQSGIDSAQ